MKRSKIKLKYLNNNKLILKDKTKEKESLLDKLDYTIIKSLITLVLIFLLLTWSYIPITILAILGIDYTNFNEIGKIIYMIVSNLLFLTILYQIYKKDIKRDFKNFFNNNLKDNLKLALRYWGIGLIIMVLSNFLISIVTNGKLATNEESVRSLINIAPWYMMFELIIYAPLSEELIFRRSIRDITKNKYIYPILSGMIFGGLHAITSLNSAIDLLYFIPYCSLGIIFALLYSKTNNIFSTITIHAFHNGLALILFLIQ